jgi:formylglycine-generating enzyme required for sulfatase activity
MAHRVIRWSVVAVLVIAGCSAQSPSPDESAAKEQARVTATATQEAVVAATAAVAAQAAAATEPQPAPTDTAAEQAPPMADLDAMVDIPVGPFQMGCSAEDSRCAHNEEPLHTVTLEAYQIDKYEVTNAQYARCVAAGKCSPPSHTSSFTRIDYYGASRYARYPVVTVDWAQAMAYCAWAGKRLPTESEWEKAARGTDTRIYPWGNEAPDCQRANFQGCEDDTAQVGSRPAGASPYGVMDMAGNVSELVADWYDAKYYTTSPVQNPMGPSSGKYRVLRGGSLAEGFALQRASFRYWYSPDRSNFKTGFRCVR